MTETHRIKVKIGAAEFEAEGDPVKVGEQYDQFLAALAASSTRGFVAAPPTAPGSGAAPQGATGVGVPAEYSTVFRKDSKGILSLLRLPQGDERTGDAVVLLLFGYKQIDGEENVLVGRLAAGLRASGLQVDRVDRNLGERDKLITSAGNSRARVYGLNNLGLQHAYELLDVLK